MLNINYDNCSADIVGAENGLTRADWETHAKDFDRAHETFAQWRTTKDAIFFDMPSYTGMVELFTQKAKHVRADYDNLLVLGIGGSALGLSCMARALLRPQYNLVDRVARGGPRLFVCDNVDPESMSALLAMLDPQKTFVNVISKSGGTTETMAQFSLVRAWLEKARGAAWKDHVCATTDPDKGLLRAYVKEHGLDALEVPPTLGGRFSVLSSVGLFPAACVGMDIAGVLAGAASMARACDVADYENNPGYRMGAASWLLATLKGKSVSVMMPYVDRLALFADWYAQLWAESLGKEGKGQTVVKSLGATDQHSQLQLFMEGPHDKMLTFMGVASFGDEGARIETPFPSFEYLKGKGLGDILRAEQKATTQALAEMRHPNMTVTVDCVIPETLGQLFFVYEVACAYAGALMQINPFDQPGVEMGKKLTKKMLEKQ